MISLVLGIEPLSDIDGPHLNIVALQFREPLEAGETWRHEENVPVPFGSGSQLPKIRFQLFIIFRIDRSEGFRADHPRHFAHDVEFNCGMGARSQ
jgi:hypothetical protein